MNVTQAFKFSNISANTASFTALGGKYLLTVAANFGGGGDVGVQALSNDGTTYVPVVGFTSDAVNSTTLEANGTMLLDLPPGTYRISVATATAVYATLARVPY